MSRMHRSPGPRLEASREELLEKERLEELRKELREKGEFMSHGYQSFEYLLEALKSSGHSQCTTVWTKGTVAYRCWTCQINDSSAICEICFHQGGHKFHDFTTCYSESGGCCDCGDRDAWAEHGFCKIHQVSNQKPGHLPAKLYEPTKMTVCWALEKLSISVHNIWVRRLKDEKAAVENEMRVARLYMEWVKKVCSVDVLRNLVSVLVTRKFLDGSLRGAKAPLEILLQTLGSMPEELTEGATTLFLQLLYNRWFKSQFTEELMKHYPLMVDDAVGKVIKHSRHEGVITECEALNSTLDRAQSGLAALANSLMELAGQPVPAQPHCIAAADNEVLSSSHQGRQKDFEDQHRDLGDDNDHGNDETVPPKGLPKGRGVEGSSKMSTGNAVLLLDPKQKIMTLEPRCKTQKCDVGNLAEKTRWQPQLKIYMYKFLDFGILEIQKQPNLGIIYSQMKEEFPRLDKANMCTYIRNRLRDLRCKWKKKWEKRQDRPSVCPEAAWKTLIGHWSTEREMAKAEKMKKARAAVKNPSRVGRGGRK